MNTENITEQLQEKPKTKRQTKTATVKNEVNKMPEETNINPQKNIDTKKLSVDETIKYSGSRIEDALTKKISTSVETFTNEVIDKSIYGDNNNKETNNAETDMETEILLKIIDNQAKQIAYLRSIQKNNLYIGFCAGVLFSAMVIRVIAAKNK